MIEKLIKDTNNAVLLTSAFLTKQLMGEPEIAKAKDKAKSKLKELEKFLSDKKDKFHKDYYFSTKSKANSYHIKISQTREIEKLKKLEEEIKKILEETKKRAK